MFILVLSAAWKTLLALNRVKSQNLLPFFRHSWVLRMYCFRLGFFFFQAEDGIRDIGVTGVQTCALPILGEAAINAAESVGYDSVGTVEFLVQDDEFFFLEMNTRVQVEHPVTEEVTGVDIVRTGIRIAAGEHLPLSQEEVFWRGHAIEVRVNAEDPANDFVPSPGAVSAYEEPGGPGIRVDSSLKGPGVVPGAYDPLFAKLIVDRKSVV